MTVSIHNIEFVYINFTTLNVVLYVTALFHYCVPMGIYSSRDSRNGDMSLASMIIHTIPICAELTRTHSLIENIDAL